MAYSLGQGVNEDGSDGNLNKKPIQNNKVYRNSLSVARSRFLKMRMRKEENRSNKVKNKKNMLQKVVNINNRPIRIQEEFGDTSEEDETEEEILSADERFRKNAENKRIISALQTDEAAASPFENFLLDFAEDEQILKIFMFWRDVEKLRMNYPFCIKDFDFYQEFVSFNKHLCS